MMFDRSVISFQKVYACELCAIVSDNCLWNTEYDHNWLLKELYGIFWCDLWQRFDFNPFCEIVNCYRRYLIWLRAGGKGPNKLMPHYAKENREVSEVRSVGGATWTSAWNCHLSHFLTSFIASSFIVGQWHPARKAFLARDLLSRCCPHIPSWISVKT